MILSFCWQNVTTHSQFHVLPFANIPTEVRAQNYFASVATQEVIESTRSMTGRWTSSSVLGLGEGGWRDGEGTSLSLGEGTSTVQLVTVDIH